MTPPPQSRQTLSVDAAKLCGFVGHRFDEDTPIAETVSGSTAEVDGADSHSIQLRHGTITRYGTTTTTTRDILSIGKGWQRQAKRAQTSRNDSFGP
jgi:hypothetical protein